jgi:hypothetical protein
VPRRTDLTAYLETLDHAELVRLLAETAERDDALRRRLAMRSAARTGASPDMRDLMRHVSEALYVGDFLSEDDAWDYAHRVSDVCDELARLHDNGESAALLGQWAIEQLGQAFDRIDDSWGYIRDAAHELTELHARVCRAARPDPPALASWLLRFQMAGYDCPYLAIGDYAEALGEPA